MHSAASCNGTGESQPACSTPVQGICPAGWHMPSHYEWTMLERAVCASGTCTSDFPYDTSTTGYRGTDEGSRLAGNVTDQSWTAGTLTGDGDFGTSGFNLPAAGLRNTNGDYGNRVTTSYPWSSSGSGSNRWYRILVSSGTIYRNGGNLAAAGFSVRCLKD